MKKNTPLTLFVLLTASCLVVGCGAQGPLSSENLADVGSGMAAGKDATTIGNLGLQEGWETVETQDPENTQDIQALVDMVRADEAYGHDGMPMFRQVRAHDGMPMYHEIDAHDAMPIYRSPAGHDGMPMAYEPIDMSMDGVQGAVLLCPDGEVIYIQAEDGKISFEVQEYIASVTVLPVGDDGQILTYDAFELARTE